MLVNVLTYWVDPPAQMEDVFPFFWVVGVVYSYDPLNVVACE